MSNHNDRQRQGVITAAIGLVLNLILGAGKLAVGIFTGSMSIVSDGVNNLSDVGTSVVTVGSFAVASKKADHGHPYGHGRAEYVASFIVSAVIIFVGAELVISSATRLITKNAAATFSVTALVLLIVSAAVKCFMAVMYTLKNRKVRSDVLRAAAFDSISDCASTALVAVAFGLDKISSFPFDSIAGILCAGLIVYGGIRLILSTVNKLMGGGSDGEVESLIASIASENPLVLGVHDLRVHDYGAGRKVASVDAEFNRELSFEAVHSAVDEMEKKAASSGVNLVVHPDPVDISDERLLQVRRAVIKTLEAYGEGASFHELSIDRQNMLIGLHLGLDERLMKEKEGVTEAIISSVKSIDEAYSVKVEYDFL